MTSMLGFFKKFGSKKQTDSVCEHILAAPDSIFCKKCGAVIRNLYPEITQSKNDGIFDRDNCYICVLHFRRKSAWVTPDSYPIAKYAVAYNGKYEYDFFDCNDDGENIKIKVDSEEITLNFATHTEKIQYTKNQVCVYHVPICDAMESWEFIICDAPIQYELFKPNFRRENDGIYYSITDMEENKRRLDNLHKRLG